MDDSSLLGSRNASVYKFESLRLGKVPSERASEEATHILRLLFDRYSKN